MGNPKLKGEVALSLSGNMIKFQKSLSDRTLPLEEGRV
jgi:hypothetical protein